MNQQVIVKQKGGVGFLSLLAIAFIVLKLMGYIAWSWVWVLSPLWIPFAILLLVFVVGICLAVISS